jgi:hypothetical protein
VAGGSGRSTRSSIHPLTEVLEPLLRDVDVRLGERAGPLLDGVEEDEEVARSLVQDPVEVPPVVAAELPQLAIDLGAVRKGEGRVVALPGVVLSRHRPGVVGQVFERDGVASIEVIALPPDPRAIGRR